MTTLYPQRKNPRLKNYDYSTNGVYFITICTENKTKILFHIATADGIIKTKLSPIGQIVERFIQTIPGIDVYVIMPNHIHIIIMKTSGKPIASDVRSFKGLTVKNCNGLILQRNYYEHIIRDEENYRIKRGYIEDNPRRWIDDEYFV